MSRFNSNTINFKAGLDASGVATGVQQIQGYMGRLNTNVNKISRTFENLGFAIGAAFSVQQIGILIESSVKLATEAEGVKRAFKNLTKEGDLSTLRQATKGMVSDFELMKQGNFAASVGIQMEDLARVMAYVAKYSQATGQSFSTLMSDATLEMIRQTGLRLDNIGINIAKVREAQGRGKDFIGAMLEQIAVSEQKLGSGSLTASENFAQMRANIEDAKISLGEKMLPIIDALIRGTKAISNNIGNYGSGITMMLGKSTIAAQETNAIFAARRFADGMKNAVVELNVMQKKLGFQKEILRAQQQLKEAEQGSFNPVDNVKKMRQTVYYTKLIEELTRQMNALSGSAGSGSGGAKDVVVTLQLLNEEMAALKNTQLTAPISEFKKWADEMDRLAYKIGVLTGQNKKATKIEGLEPIKELSKGIAELSKMPKKLEAIPNAQGDAYAKMMQHNQELAQDFERMARQIKDAFNMITASLVADIMSSIGASLVEGKDAFKDFGQNALNALGEFAQKMGALMIAYGIAKLKLFESLFSGPAGAVQAIAAGAALAAIGGAISATQKRFGESNMTSTSGASYGGVPTSTDVTGYNFQGRVDGYDLVLVTDRNQRLMNRRG